MIILNNIKHSYIRATLKDFKNSNSFIVKIVINLDNKGK
jgi:hypothetical protein